VQTVMGRPLVVGRHLGGLQQVAVVVHWQDDGYRQAVFLHDKMRLVLVHAPQNGAPIKGELGRGDHGGFGHRSSQMIDNARSRITPSESPWATDSDGAMSIPGVPGRLSLSILVNPEFPGFLVEIVVSLNGGVFRQDAFVFPVTVPRHAEKRGDGNLPLVAPELDPPAGYQVLIEQTPDREGELL